MWGNSVPHDSKGWLNMKTFKISFLDNKKNCRHIEVDAENEGDAMNEAIFLSNYEIDKFMSVVPVHND